LVRIKFYLSTLSCGIDANKGVTRETLHAGHRSVAHGNMARMLNDQHRSLQRVVIELMKWTRTITHAYRALNTAAQRLPQSLAGPPQRQLPQPFSVISLPVADGGADMPNHGFPQTVAEERKASAFQRGHVAGRDRAQIAAHCPYGHAPGEFELRMAWLDGFSSGRIGTSQSNGQADRDR
jgi:hypothetical protein